MIDREALAAGLDEAGAEAWLLYDFRGNNPVAARVMGFRGMATRRYFVLFPRHGEPVAVAHRVELKQFDGFAGRVIPYSQWEELHSALGSVVGGKRVAMEISPEDAVPYLDRIPHGVVQLLSRLGATVVPSGSLPSLFASRWSAEELEGHRRAAESLASIAREQIAWAVTRGGSGLREAQLQQRVVDAIHRAGLEFDHPPIVGFGPNAANPHYEPVPGSDAELEQDQVVLVDLWGGPAVDTVYADQTWMGFSGANPPAKVRKVWETVREARIAACETLREKAASGAPVAGFEGDRAARSVIAKAGYGKYFVHRTGHSIDRDLHGSGPHLDDFETHDDRRLHQGLGWSVEPGIYLPGEFGVRSEVNMYWGEAGPEVTPTEPQADLILA